MYHVNAWLNPFTVHLKPLQHSLLIGYAQCKIKSFKKSAVCQYTNNERSEIKKTIPMKDQRDKENNPIYHHITKNKIDRNKPT